MNKSKLIIFTLLVIGFIITLFYSVFGFQLSYLSLEKIKDSRKLKPKLVNELRINNVDVPYDKNNNLYYYTIPDKYESQNYILKFELESGYKYKIKNQILNLIKVDYEKQINIIIYNDKYYDEIKIQLTNLPIVSISSEKELHTEDVSSVFTYINSELTEKQTTIYSKIHQRGASSIIFPKKSYRVNFFNKEYKKKKDIVLSNFYNGDSLILDSVYRDYSKIRNVLATQLWNDISNDFSSVNIYSEFVELFINSEYMGLYSLIEPINRTKLVLDKSNLNNSSIVIKSLGWNTIGEETDFKNIKSERYIDYEIKYPNNQKLYSSAWFNFLNKISGYYNPKNTKTYKIINNTFDEKNYIDIILFNSFINNIDSCLIYNQYFYMKNFDSKVYIQPWDMEFSFGYHDSRRNEEIMGYDNIVCEFYHPYSKKINKLLIERYWELRDNILTKKYFDNLLNKYLEKLNKGASLRDSNKWYEYKVEKEIEEIRSWIYNRLEFFDGYVESIENGKF